MQNKEGKDSNFGVTTRRNFLRSGTIATAGAVAMGLGGNKFWAQDSTSTLKKTAGGDDELKLISPTFETSPTYLATYPASDRAKKICKDALLMDTLFSAVYPLQWKNDDQFDPVMDDMIATGFNVLGICTGADSNASDPASVLNAARFYAKKIFAKPEKYKLVYTTADIRQAVKEGKLAIYLIHQGTNVFQGNVDNVALMKAMGYGYCLMVYNVKNEVGGGCAEDDDPGLSDYGRKLIQAYNKYGMVVDVNHTGNKTALDACEASAKPVIFSHSGAKGVCKTFRNCTDELIIAIAKTGGVCSMYGTGAYMDPTNPPVVGPEIIFKHFDYMCQLHGNADHVGYGSDWIPDMNGTMKLILANASTYPDGGGMAPGTTKKAIEMYGPTANPSRILPALVDQFLDHGYSEKDIYKILGGNMMRVFDECWTGSDVQISDSGIYTGDKPSFPMDWR